MQSVAVHQCQTGARATPPLEASRSLSGWHSKHSSEHRSTQSSGTREPSGPDELTCQNEITCREESRDRAWKPKAWMEFVRCCFKSRTSSSIKWSLAVTWPRSEATSSKWKMYMQHRPNIRSLNVNLKPYLKTPSRRWNYFEALIMTLKL